MKKPITDITQLDFNKTYSYADYLSWHFLERVELIWGRIRKMSAAPSTIHQKVLGALFTEISTELRKHPCQVFIAPFDVRLPGKDKKDNAIENVVQPDLCVVCDEDKIDDKGCVGAPDLIVEVLSPASSTRDLKDKLSLYEHAGVPEYWVVDPHDGIVQIFILNENAKYISRHPVTCVDILESEVISGLHIQMQEIFPDILKEPEEPYGPNMKRI